MVSNCWSLTLRPVAAVQTLKAALLHRFQRDCTQVHSLGCGLVRMTWVGIGSGFRAHSRGRRSMLAGWFRTVGRLRCAAKPLSELRETFRAIDTKEAVRKCIASVAVW